MADYSSNALLTPRQAVDTMNWVIGEVKAMLAKALLQDFKAQCGEITLSERDKAFSISSFIPVDTPDIEKAALAGYCGHAQSFLTWALQDMGYAPKCFTFEEEQKDRASPTGATHKPCGAHCRHSNNGGREDLSTRPYLQTILHR